jgi:hypothetical protein
VVVLFCQYSLWCPCLVEEVFVGFLKAYFAKSPIKDLVVFDEHRTIYNTARDPISHNTTTKKKNSLDAMFSFFVMHHVQNFSASVTKDPAAEAFRVGFVECEDRYLRLNEWVAARIWITPLARSRLLF